MATSAIPVEPNVNVTVPGKAKFIQQIRAYLWSEPDIDVHQVLETLDV
jgi:hypothetical protein